MKHPFRAAGCCSSSGTARRDEVDAGGQGAAKGENPVRNRHGRTYLVAFETSVATVLNAGLSARPSNESPPTMATATKAAMRPYSMAVAPFLSPQTLLRNLRM